MEAVENVAAAGALPSNAPASNFSSYLPLIDKYRLEWSDLSNICEDPRLLHLRQMACDGSLKVAKFRSICWSVLLDVLRGDQTDWLQQRRVHRAMYQRIKATWTTNPHTAETSHSTEVVADDPLSQSQQSVWNQHFCDQELFAVIRQDVVRTFPGVDFYRRSSVQELMVDILFCYARQHPAMCYRQGMHEILAPVLFVMHCDQQTLLHVCDVVREHRDEEPVDGVGDVVLEMLDPQFMEEDAYFMFTKIMASIESFYHIRDMKPTPSGHFPQPSVSSGDKRSKLEVVGQLNYIRDKILAYVDPQLHKHLLALDIPLTLFGIRWLRLLFGREFSLQELLVLWDAIFAYGNLFALTNFVVVAMLVQIRQLLLNGDYTTCLTHLMKYPSNIDISLVIRYAMHIKSPQTHPCPAGSFPPQFRQTAAKPEPQRQQPVDNRAANHRRAASSDDATRMAGVRPVKPTTAGNSSTATDEQLRAHMQAIQKTAAAEHLKPYTGEQDSSIVEGFRVNSPEALRLELESARAVMSFTRFKLIQYLGVLRKHRPNGAAVDSVNQALDGIEELCSMLQTKPSPTDYARPMPVECAFEANEPTIPLQINQQSSNPTSAPIKKPLPLTKNHPHDSTRRAFVQQLCNDDFEVVVHPDNGGLIDSLLAFGGSGGGGDSNAHDPMQRRSNGSANSRYEIPDDDRLMSRKVTKILGDRREVEMHEFRSAPVAESVVSSTVDEDPPGERYLAGQ